MSSSLKYAPSTGNLVLGEGGYGMVVRNQRNANLAHKLMKDNTSCKKAHHEFAMHKRIYDTFKAFMQKHPALRGHIDIPEPKTFTDCKACRSATQQCHACTEPYHCVYSMRVVRSARRDGLMEHVFLGDPDQRPEIHFVRQTQPPILANTNRNLTPAQKKMGPRGVFIGQKTLRARGLDVKAVAYGMGVLHQLMFAAGLSPFDVEYVLGLPHGKKSNRRASCLYAMDFGMSDLNYGQGYDDYAPDQDSPDLLAQFELGKDLVKAWQGSGAGKFRRTASVTRRPVVVLRRSTSLPTRLLARR